MSYKQSKYILLRWEKTNPLVKLLCCNQRLITVGAGVRASWHACLCPSFFSRVHFWLWAKLPILYQESVILWKAAPTAILIGINSPRFLRGGDAKGWFLSIALFLSLVGLQLRNSPFPQAQGGQQAVRCPSVQEA